MGAQLSHFKPRLPPSPQKSPLRALCCEYGPEHDRPGALLMKSSKVCQVAKNCSLPCCFHFGAMFSISNHSQEQKVRNMISGVNEAMQRTNFLPRHSSFSAVRLLMSPTLLYLGLPWLTGALVFSIQGVTIVIVGLIRALGPFHGEETCSTEDSICLRHRKQIRLGSKVQTLVYSDEHRYSHRRRLGSATYNSDTIDA